MKQIKRISLVLMLFVATAGMIACEEEEPTTVNDVNGGCEDELANLADILYDRSMTFNSNPTNSNCNSVRNAALNLINAAEDCGYGEYYEGQTETWLSLDCNVFD